MAGSLIGAVDDASGIYFNPAGIAQGQGLEVEIGTAPIIPAFTVTNPAGKELNGVSNIITPVHLYATWGISDEWTVGLGITTPFGLKVEWDPTWEGREIIKKADLKIYNINPTAAWRPNNGPFRIGGGVQIVRATVELTKDINLLDNGYVGVDLGAGAWGVGGNVGIQYDAVPKILTLGATYRSSVNLNFSGQAHFSNVPPPYAGTFKDQTATTKLKLPDNIGFGFAVRPIPELVIDVDFNYFAWQQFQAIDIKFNDPTLNTYEAKQWSHTWNYRIGAEYTLNEHIQLRTGFLYDKTPSPTYTLLPDIPDTDRINIGIGGTYRFGAFRIELAYQFIKFLGATSTYPNPKYQYDYNVTAHVIALTFGFKI
jgi:long-chain fatty acid transport protein